MLLMGSKKAERPLFISFYPSIRPPMSTEAIVRKPLVDLSHLNRALHITPVVGRRSGSDQQHERMLWPTP